MPSPTPTPTSPLPPPDFSSLPYIALNSKELKGGAKGSPTPPTHPTPAEKPPLQPHSQGRTESQPGRIEGQVPLLQVAPGLPEPSREQCEGLWTVAAVQVAALRLIGFVTLAQCPVLSVATAPPHLLSRMVMERTGMKTAPDTL